MIASVLTAPKGPFWFVLLVVAGLVLAGAIIVRAPRDHALIAKQVLRDACALHGVTHAQLAKLLSVSLASVDAALSDARENAVPDTQGAPWELVAGRRMTMCASYRTPLT